MDEATQGEPFEEAAHDWINGRSNAGQWMAAQTAFRAEMARLRAIEAAARAVNAAWDEGSIEVVGLDGLNPMDSLRAALEAPSDAR